MQILPFAQNPEAGSEFSKLKETLFSEPASLFADSFQMAQANLVAQSFQGSAEATSQVEQLSSTEVSSQDLNPTEPKASESSAESQTASKETEKANDEADKEGALKDAESKRLDAMAFEALLHLGPKKFFEHNLRLHSEADLPNAQHNVGKVKEQAGKNTKALLKEQEVWPKEAKEAPKKAEAKQTRNLPWQDHKEQAELKELKEFQATEMQHKQVEQKLRDAAFAKKWHKNQETAPQTFEVQEKTAQGEFRENNFSQAPSKPSSQTHFGGSEQGFAENQRQDLNSWGGLLSKIQLGQEGAVRPKGPNPSFEQGLALAEGPLQTFNQPRPSLPPQALPRQVAAQVESGLFSTLKSGGSRLELQLHPQELGSLAITLVAKNGEVSARIRADSPETVEMLTKQAEAIRQNLEDQGLTVDKIEVELKEQQDTANSEQFLQDMANHNSFQEEGARREELRRLRNLARLEQDSRGATAKDSARPDSVVDESRMLDRVA